MKKQINSQLLFFLFAFSMLLLLPLEVEAQGRVKAFRLLPLVLGLFSNTAGLIAVFGSAMYAKENKEDIDLARWVAFIGGAWCAFTWFGWPFSTETVFVGLGFQPLEVKEFSFLCLVGLVVFGAIGVGIFSSIADNDDDNTNEADNDQASKSEGTD